MKIRIATLKDLDSILRIYEHARSFMASHGNPTQWGTTYPPVDMIEHDIRMGNAYVCEENNRVIAVFYYAFENDVTYTTIYDGNWLNDAPYGVVHRIASDGTVKGAASFCLSWAFSQCHNLKIDTHQDNLVMQSLLAKLDFKKCGTILTEDKLILMIPFVLKLLLALPTFLSAKQVRNLAHYCHCVQDTPNGFQYAQIDCSHVPALYPILTGHCFPLL